MDNSVCIVGIGAMTPVGLNAPASAAAIRGGISGFAEHPFLINQEGDPYILASVPGMGDHFGTQRYIDLALPAIEEALFPLLKMNVSLERIPFIIGLPERRPGVPDDLTNKLKEAIKKIGGSHAFVADVSTESKGHSAGLIALEKATQLISKRSVKFCLIGGIDSYIDPETLGWIERNEQLHTPLNAWGFIPGEAAAFCLICRTDTARRLDFPIKVRLLSVNTAHEENKIKTKKVCIGKGLTEAVRMVVQTLPKETRVHQTYCDQNGEAYRADELGFTLARLSEHFIDPSDFTAPADCWGDVGAASGPLFINLFSAAIEKDYAKGVYSLLWTSSEGGERSAAVFISDKQQSRNN